jgi:hypothetical protein
MKKLSILFIAIALVFMFALVVGAEELEKNEQEFDFFQWCSENITVEKVVATATAIVSAFMTAIVTKIMKRIGADKEINTQQLNAHIENGVKQIVEKALLTYQQPFIQKTNDLEASVGKLVKGIALLQDGTPQSKLAMYDLIESTGIVDKSTIEQCKEDVQEQIDKEEEKKQEKAKKLTKIAVPME